MPTKKGSKTGSKNNSIKKSSEKGKKIIILTEKDVLAPFGYSNVKQLTVTNRHSALTKATKKLKVLSVLRRLVALATLNKKNKFIHSIFMDDAEWIKKNFM